MSHGRHLRHPDEELAESGQAEANTERSRLCRLGREAERLTEYAVQADIRAMVGVPSCTLVLLKKIVQDTGKTNPELWPRI